jgi:Ca2+-transporting ATPase
MIAEDEESFIPSLDPGISPGTKLLTIKGSPPEVLALCRQYLLDGQIIPLSETDRLTIELENERMGSEGLRVLGMGFAFLEGNGNGADVVEGRGFAWIGLVGMADPLRPGVKEAIRIFHQAGIAPLMITGDQVPIAHSVGRELNLSRGLPLEIFDSAHLQGLDPELLSTFARRVHAFARVSPAQKLQIVQALQRAGLVVAMTGDGINDGPALKAADIGIAMGAAGTDVAREIADVVLEDDNLETMIVAIRQGRAVYDNIRKSIHFLLATNMSEVALMGSAITMGIGQPLNPMQLLWINLVSDIFPGLALAVEQPEPDVMARPPRDPQETIITNDRLYRMTFESLVIGAGALSAYGYGILRYGMGPQAGSIAFLSLVFGQLLHAFSCRSERVSAFEAKTLSPNPYLTLAVAGTFGLQILAIGIPGMRRLLGISPVTALDGMVIGGSALLPLMVNETTKKMLKEGTP